MDYLHRKPVIEIKVGENGNKLAFKRNNTLSTIWPSMILIILIILCTCMVFCNKTEQACTAQLQELKLISQFTRVKMISYFN